MTIKRRIVIWYTIWMALLVAAASLLLILGSGVLLRHEAAAELEERVYDALGSVRYSDGNLRLRDDLEFFDDGFYISIWDNSGNLLAGRVPDPISSIPFSLGTLQESSGTNGSWYIFDETPFGSGEFIVRGASRSYNIGAFFGSMRLYALLILPVLVVFAAIGGYMIVRRAFRPVESVISTAGRIVDADDLSMRIDPGKGSGEIVEMASAFNAMLDRLESSFEKEKQFVSDASHELRTPISVIMAESEYALDHQDDSRRMASSLRSIHEQSGKMSRLVSELMTIARQDNGTVKPEKCEIDLLELAESTLLTLEPRAKEKNISFEIKGEEVKVLADLDMLTRVIINLVSNAISYGRDGGHIEVEISERGEDAVISVKDDGIGIEKENLQRIWDRFYQEDPSRNSSGSGLGLSIVSGIAKIHGGRTEVESEKGKGSTFRFIIPKGI